LAERTPTEDSTTKGNSQGSLGEEMGGRDLGAEGLLSGAASDWERLGLVGGSQGKSRRPVVLRGGKAGGRGHSFHSRGCLGNLEGRGCGHSSGGTGHGVKTAKIAMGGKEVD